MRKANQEITDPEILHAILNGSTVCRVAMNDNGTPYLLPFNYGYKNGCIYIHTSTEGKKLEILRKFPRVCFEIELKAEIIRSETPCNWATRYRSIIGYGTVEILADYEKKREGLQIIMEHYGAKAPYVFPHKQVDSVMILRLGIDSMTGKQSGQWEELRK